MRLNDTVYDNNNDNSSSVSLNPELEAIAMRGIPRSALKKLT